MQYAITGSTGLLGTTLTRRLDEAGHNVIRLVRGSAAPVGNAIDSQWDPYRKEIDLEALDGCDVVINLSGANIAESRWTSRRKRIIVDSRTVPTGFISESLARLDHKPRVLISASATGYYGVVGPPEAVDESHGPGEGFLAEVCRKWEEATRPAEEAGIRTVHTRFGVVMSTEGGALAKVLPMFRRGLGGRIGSGKQRMSWISETELPDVIEHIIANEDISGPVNVVTPNSITNREFTDILGDVLQKRQVASVPAAAIKFALGKMAEETILSDLAVHPKVLIDSGYDFSFPDFRKTLEYLLG